MSTTTEIQPVNATPTPMTISERFVQKVERQFVAEMGSPISWTPLQKALAQHLYVKIDAALSALEIKRASNSYKKNDPPITWENVNMTKLAIDACNRVNVGLDANIPNHIHVIPYLNKRTGKYDVDLRIGYTGVDHCARNFATDPPIDIKYQLVHETDVFKYGTQHGIAFYDYQQTSPFDPGKVIGGFGYVSYEDPRKNQVVIVEAREFEKARKASGGVEFWGGEQTGWVDGKKVNTGYDEKFEKEMQFKTVVIRVTKKIALDPSKINAATLSAISEAHMDAIDAEITEEVAANANREPLSLSAPTIQDAATSQPERQPSLVEEPPGETEEF